MPRPPRIVDPNGISHILNRGNNGQNVFRNEEDFVFFEGLLRAAKAEYGLEIYHYNLLNNHFHTTMNPNGGDISKIMRQIGWDCTTHAKKNYGFVGQFWQGRFKSYSITNDSYMLTCGIYIELNAVRAGLAATPEEYRWSSSNAYLTGAVNDLITPDPTFLALGNTDEERRVAYRKLMTMWLDFPVSKTKARRFFKNGAGRPHPSFR